MEIRLFADRLEIWSPGHLPPEITIPELYEEHDSHPVNKEILKAFDKINVIESLGTGIERMISACHASGLPTPVFEYHGSAFVVTILKDAWTRTALESLDLNPDQIKAVSYVKVNGWISAPRYAELYKVPMRTSSRELAELARKGVFVLMGKGRQSRYELKSNRARIAPIAPNSRKGLRTGENGQNIGKSAISRRRGSVKTVDKTVVKTVDKKPDGTTNDRILDLLATNPRATQEELARVLGLSVRGIEYATGVLKRAKRLRKVGGKKLGHWEVLQ